MPLDEAAVAGAAERLAVAGVAAVAVGFLHTYRNDAHERHAGAILQRLMPRSPAGFARRTPRSTATTFRGGRSRS